MSLYDYYYHQPSSVVTPPAQTFDEVVEGKSPTCYWHPGENATTVSDRIGALDLTWSGTPTIGVTDIDGTATAATLDGSTEWLGRADDAAFDVGTNDFSFMCAVKLAAWPSTIHGWLWGHHGGGGAGDIAIYLDRFDTDRISMNLSGTAYTFDPLTTPLADGAWHLIVIAADRSGNCSMWLDDDAAVTADISAQVAVSLTTTSVLRVGARQVSPTDFLNGSLGKVAWWNGTLLTSTDRDDIWGAI